MSHLGFQPHQILLPKGIKLDRFVGSLSEYSLGDALGSVRQLVDGSGQVTVAQSYTPYGEVLASEGSGETAYAFTGEMYDPGTGLVYLRARYYAHYLNQFIQADPIVPNPRQPWNWNKYTYVQNNPVNLTDPRGLSPITSLELPDQRDLTFWLYEEMSANANGYYAQRINSLLNSSDLTQKARAVMGWIFLVKNKAKWDPKHRIKELFEGKESVLLTSSEGFAWYEYSVPGNIHYGFVGRATGFSGIMLHAGAGYAEITDPAHQDRGEACCPKFCKDIVSDPQITLNVCIPLGCYYVNPEWVSTLFDDPGDYLNVEFGVKLYDTYHSQMTYRQFQDYLATYGYWLTPATEIPEKRFEHPDWPYWVGYFDGPDTQRNKPIVDLLLWRSPFGD